MWLFTPAPSALPLLARINTQTRARTLAKIYITAAHNCRSAAARLPAEIFAYADIFFDDRGLFPQHSSPFHTTRSAFSSAQSDQHKQETTDTEPNIY
jgi:hypothetical protein